MIKLKLAEILRHCSFHYRVNDSSPFHYKVESHKIIQNLNVFRTIIAYHCLKTFIIIIYSGISFIALLFLLRYIVHYFFTRWIYIEHKIIINCNIFTKCQTLNIFVTLHTRV